MDLFDGLNPQQRSAVEAGAGPVLVLAGPGSGKTRVLTQRAAYLIAHLGVPPYRILAVTFTNKAAREMRRRLEAGAQDSTPGPGGSLGGMWIGTFHAACARLLRRESGLLPFTGEFVIYDESDQLALVRQALMDLNLDDKRYRPASMLAAISRAKNELLPPEDLPAETYYAEVVRQVYERYQELLRASNALDFDDLLTNVVWLFRDRPEALAKYQRHFEHILVDEFQDTNTVQYALLRQLAAQHRNLFVVGDPDQSVYGWRGADYRNVHRFQDDYPDALTILLEQNYRSTQTILDAAMAVIDRNVDRTPKRLFTRRPEGEQIYVYEAYNEAEEAQFVVETIAALTLQAGLRPGDCAVMYRTNAQSRPLEDAFVAAGLPYRLVGATRFYARQEIKDLLAYLRLVHNPADSVSLARIINVPRRGIGPKALEALFAAASGAGVPPADVLRDLAEHKSRSRFSPTLGRAAGPLAAFGLMLDHWLNLRADLSPLQLLDLIIERAEYEAYLRDGSEEGEERWENVQQLRLVAREAGDADLASFLEQIALVSDVDNLVEDGQAPTLMTLHSAKGLEFGVVFIVGLEEGVLPHQRSLDDPEAVAEERRLMYVGVTRAKDRLYLVHCFRRSLMGSSELGRPSRFLDDLPRQLIAGNLARSNRAAEWEGRRPSAPPPAPLAQRYRTGQRVSHASFGQGIVIESKIVGDDEEIVVAFEDVGVKRLAAVFANLEILSD